MDSGGGASDPTLREFFFFADDAPDLNNFDFLSLNSCIMFANSLSPAICAKKINYTDIADVIIKHTYLSGTDGLFPGRRPRLRIALPLRICVADVRVAITARTRPVVPHTIVLHARRRIRVEEAATAAEERPQARLRRAGNRHCVLLVAGVLVAAQ